MITRLKLGLVLISVLALLTLMPLTSGADEGVIDLTRITPEELTMPLASIRNRLSGRSWLITTGQDPALGIGLDGSLSIPSTSIGGLHLSRLEAVEQRWCRSETHRRSSAATY